MARKTKTITIDEDNRDNGKTFILVEMPARQAEEWGTRAMLALARSGSESIASIGQMDDAVFRAGLAGVAAVGIGLFGRIRWEDAKALKDELFAQVSYVYDQKTPCAVRGKGDFKRDDVSNYKSFGPIKDDDIEEVSTRVLLHKELFELHTGFSFAAAISSLIASMTTARQENTENTSTYHDQ
jgi:hypothetical protein